MRSGAWPQIPARCGAEELPRALSGIGERPVTVVSYRDCNEIPHSRQRPARFPRLLPAFRAHTVRHHRRAARQSEEHYSMPYKTFHQAPAAATAAPFCW